MARTPETVVERRRAKYVAVSRLTDDYLGTSGIIMAFEGELDGADLLSLVRQYNDGESDLLVGKSSQLTTKSERLPSHRFMTISLLRHYIGV